MDAETLTSAQSVQLHEGGSGVIRVKLRGDTIMPAMTIPRNPSLLVLCLCVWTLVSAQPVLMQTITYNFMDCLVKQEEVWPVHGASVWSQKDSSYTEAEFQCTVGFKVMQPEMRFLVNFLMLDLPSRIGGVCRDTLTVWQSSDHGNTTMFGPLCGYLADLMPSQAYTQPGADVWIRWQTANRDTGTYTGFNIVLTAVVPPTKCDPELHYVCEKSGDCVSSSLLCDEVPHCLDHSDETACEPPHMVNLGGNHGQGSSNYSYAGSMTTIKSTVHRKDSTEDEGGESAPDEVFQDVDMVSIIVVGVLFVVILVICVVLACRSKGNDMEPLTEETNQLRLDLSSAQGVSEMDGVPVTPPPTYSMIERQTSYVSQISMSSSQVSIPPDYDEALELDEHGNPRPRRTPSRHSSHSRYSFQGSSGGVRPIRSASGYSKSRPHSKKFQRSQSATDDPNSSRPRYLSQASTISEVGPIDEDSILEVADDIFQQSPSDPSPSSHPKGPVTSTPHEPTPYHIEMIREDSRAPLFRLGGISDTSEEASLSATEPSSQSVSRESEDGSQIELNPSRRGGTRTDYTNGRDGSA